MLKVETDGEVYAVCNGCGETYVGQDDWKSGRLAGEWIDLCPNCQEKKEKENDML